MPDRIPPCGLRRKGLIPGPRSNFPPCDIFDEAFDDDRGADSITPERDPSDRGSADVSSPIESSTSVLGEDGED